MTKTKEIYKYLMNCTNDAPSGGVKGTGLLSVYKRIFNTKSNLRKEQLVEALVPLHLSTEIIKKLEQTLQLADMVKFAKGNPLPDENNASYKNIVDFVQMTKEEKVTTQNNS